MRTLYEVRVREKNGTGDVKKSKFYKASSPSDAASKYKGSGTIMWVQKASKEKLLGIGEFFSLGGVLLKEFAEAKSLEQVLKSKEKEKNRSKRFLNKQRKLVLR